MKNLFPKYWINLLFLFYIFNCLNNGWCHHHDYTKRFSCFFNLMSELKEMHCFDLININYHHVTTPASVKEAITGFPVAIRIRRSENESEQQGNHVVKKDSVGHYEERNIHHCVAFMPYDLQKYGRHSFSGSTFMCDYKGFCDGFGTGIIPGATINSIEGELYCCNTTGCNTLESVEIAVGKELKAKASVSHCYQGVADQVATNSCVAPSNGCQVLTKHSATPLSLYQCNEIQENLCHIFDIKDNRCRNVSYPELNGGNATLCCCYNNNCNHPPLSRLQKLLNLKGAKGQLTVISLGIMWGLLSAVMIIGLGTYLVIKRYGSWRKMPVLRTWSYSAVDDTLYRNMDDETYSGLLGRLY